MLFDSHAHVNFEKFQNDFKEVLDDCQKNKVWLVNIGSQYHTSKRGVILAEMYEQGMYAAVGVHPTHAHEAEHAFDYKKYADLIRSSKKVLAVGETGIDFFHSANNFEAQKKSFLGHIQLAKEFDLALVIHGRNSKDEKLSSYQEILKIVKKEKVKRAVIHCFIGAEDDAKSFLELGYYIGITGIVTFENASRVQAVVQNSIPLEQLLVETDSPYLAPEPYRGQRNKPQYVEYVARKVAELKETEYAMVAENTFQNAQKLFRVTK